MGKPEIHEYFLHVRGRQRPHDSSPEGWLHDTFPVERLGLYESSLEVCTNEQDVSSLDEELYSGIHSFLQIHVFKIQEKTQDSAPFRFFLFEYASPFSSVFLWDRHLFFFHTSSFYPPPFCFPCDFFLPSLSLLSANE